MPLYYNNIGIGGRIVATPECKPTRDGTPRVRFTVALNNPRKSAPMYVKCLAWGDKALHISQMAEKGQEILVQGEIETSTWEDRHQMKHTTTEVVVDKFNLGSKSKSKPKTATIIKPLPPIRTE